jgi:hypothetical protein
MAGTFPTEPGYRNVQTNVRHYNLMSESINGRVQVRSLGASRREFVVQFPPMTKAEFEPIYDFLLLQQGMLETFSISIPNPTETGYETVTVRLANDVQEFSVGVDSLYEFEVDLIEEVV